MTDEQIKQNAETAYPGFEDLQTVYIEGAHSRDEEIECLAKNYKEEFDAQEEELDSLRKGFYERGEKLKELMLANNQLRNPWISVEERLPERMTSRDSNGVKIIHCCSKDVFGYDASYKIGRLVCYNHESEMWESHDVYTIGEITHWMPIPELKKGE